MRILIISYHFPPDAEIGSVRPYQLARLLPEHGIEPWVLTVRPEFAERRDDKYQADAIPTDQIVRTNVLPSRLDRIAAWNAALRKRARRGTSARAVAQESSPTTQPTIRRTSPRRARFLSWVAYPDARAGWLAPAVAAGSAVLRQQPFDAIVSTSPPRVAHLVARELAARHRVPWIMDLRDPWLGAWDDASGSPALSAMYRRLLTGCLGQAAAVVTNTERLQVALEMAHPLIRGRAFTVPNGCPTQLERGGDSLPRPSTFSIGHYGFLMGQRNPSAFLQGLRLWLDQSDQPRDVTAAFVGGGYVERTEGEARQLQLDAVVRQQGSVPRDEVARLMAANYALLIIANAQPLQIPGKVYEYLAAGRRILALTEHDSALADLLRGVPHCAIVSNPGEVARALDAFWTDYSHGADAQVDHHAFLDRCSYARRAAQYAEIIHRVGALPTLHQGSAMVSSPAGTR